MSDENESGRYPEIPIDSGEADQIVRILSGWDESHLMKSLACLLVAEREYQFAVEDGEAPDLPFSEYADKGVERAKEMIAERYHEDRS